MPRFPEPDEEPEVSLNSVLTASQLLKRWPGCLEDELYRMVKSQKLKSYFHIKTLQNEAGERLFFCRGGNNVPHVRYEGDFTEYYWYEEPYQLGIVFDVNDVEATEKQHPEFFWKPVAPHSEVEKAQQDDEWIPADEVRRELELSPSKMVDELESERLETDKEEDFRRHRKNVSFPHENPFFTVAMLTSLKIHRTSLSEYQNRKTMAFWGTDWDLAGSGDAKEMESLRAWNKRLNEINQARSEEVKSLQQTLDESKQKIERLAVENIALQAEVEHLKAAQDALPRTAAATEKAQESRVEEWKAYAACMVKATVDIVAGGKRDLTRRQIGNVLKPHGQLNQVALECFRSALPDEYVRKSGGPSRQG